MSGENQFHLRFKSFFEEHFPLDGNKGELYSLLEFYDDNYFIMTEAQANFKKHLNEYIEEGKNSNSFRISLKVIYHMNMYIRMLATLDDILIKIGVYNHILDNINVSDDEIYKLKGESINTLRKYFNDPSRKRNDYPLLPSKLNRKTRLLRNDLTHNGELQLFKGLEKQKGIVGWSSPSGIFKRNLRSFEYIEERAKYDIEEITFVKNRLEVLVLNNLNVEKRTFD